MAYAVRMPPLGQTTDELRIVEWLRAEGDEVARGDLLLAVETDKATLEVEAASVGTLLKIVHGPGDTVGVGSVVGWIGEPGEQVPAEEEAARPAERKAAAPVVRRLAQEHGIDLAAVQGSGPGGRVEKEDVLALIEAAGGGEPVPRHRRALAERLTRSAAVPQFSVSVVADMTEAAAALERVPGLGYTHLLLRALAAALREHTNVNRLWVTAGPRVRRLERADVGLAVAGEDTLLVVTIPEPDRADAEDLVALVERAVHEARAGRISESFGGPAAVTLSNLGGYGVDRFEAIVDPDQTAILATGRVAERPAVVEGRVEPCLQLELTLTVDHRVLDGAAAAAFLETVRGHLETAALA